MKAVPSHKPQLEIVQRGNLRETSFADLLVALLDQRRSGTLRILDAQGQLQGLVRFEAGLPVAARAPRLATNLIQSLIPLCACADGDYGFAEAQDDVGSGEGVVEGRVDPLSLIAAVFRGPAREDVVNASLERLGTRVLQLHPRVRIERYRFTQQELQVVELLRRVPLGLAELESHLPPRVARRVIYVLSVTRGVSPITGNRRVVSGTIEHVEASPALAESADVTVPESRRSQRVAKPPPLPGTSEAPGRYHVHAAKADAGEQPLVVFESSALPPALQLWASEIRSRAALIKNQDHYAALGVTSGCDEAELRKAYAELDARFRPSSLPDELAGLRARATRLHTQLTQAYQTLLDPSSRERYDLEQKSVPRLLDPKLQLARVMESDTHYKEAERLLRLRDYPVALAHVEQALRCHRSARNEALYAWLLCMRPDDPDAIHPRAFQFLDNALRRDPHCVQAHHYKAMLLKRSGEFEQARQQWKRVLKLSPEHVEAARELRLLDARHPPRSSSGLMGRLFSRPPASKPDDE